MASNLEGKYHDGWTNPRGDKGEDKKDDEEEWMNYFVNQIQF